MATALKSQDKIEIFQDRYNLKYYIKIIRKTHYKIETGAGAIDSYETEYADSDDDRIYRKDQKGIIKLAKELKRLIDLIDEKDKKLDIEF